MRKLMLIIVGILAVSLIVSGSAMAANKVLRLNDDYFSSDCIEVEWGPGTIDSQLDLYGKGAGFALSGLNGSGTGIGDNWWGTCQPGPSSLSGLGIGPDGFFTDATGYGKLRIKFTNLGRSDVKVAVFMNTGLTVPGFGCGAPACDTYYQSPWRTVRPGKTNSVTLNFKNAVVYNAADDPVPANVHPDGTTGVTVVRLDEVTNLGFQVLDPSNGANDKAWLRTSR
ncbi:MAG: hypothetical protein D8M57_18470 [Candidatus Scalindua sp. AMX11]|nr:MAG: hypothetical protein DWQ00_04495 [Candidatus Scalindua sp.]NOG83644.1 hypothetical protein [Planctomycetota bacterium]RZV63225.1 MAG: hypothetical protein EX341_18375 [Candidatus Scalindua sp. SCAELEC01]TDE63404.1 MAG: hypothetical protein D8M57_18470 [Candidatus Scalindua sp. AMX11]GJQ57339.1 MAG: hypothetical protein SCALA701_01400 [Candidatus Scalindua sp.]